MRAKAGSTLVALGVLAVVLGASRISFAQDSAPNPKPSGAAPVAAPSPDAKKSEQAPAAATPLAAKPAAPLDPAQAQLLADTERLVKLSEELKAEVAKSNKDTLSLSVIKKAEEVEKLAKSLKERMNRNQ